MDHRVKDKLTISVVRIIYVNKYDIKCITSRRRKVDTSTTETAGTCDNRTICQLRYTTAFCLEACCIRTCLRN